MSSGSPHCGLFFKGIKLCELELHVPTSEAGSSKSHLASSLFTGTVTLQAAGCPVGSMTSQQPPCCEEAQAAGRGQASAALADNPNPGTSHVRQQPPGVLTSPLSDPPRLSPALGGRERGVFSSTFCRHCRRVSDE